MPETYIVNTQYFGKYYWPKYYWPGWFLEYTEKVELSAVMSTAVTAGVTLLMSASGLVMLNQAVTDCAVMSMGVSENVILNKTVSGEYSELEQK